MVKAQNAHNEIHLRHREQIAQWVRDRKLSLVTPAGIETTILDEGCIRLADVKAYLEQCCIPYREDGPRTASSSRPLGNATGADAFSEEDRRRLLDAEFWGERELLGLCFGVREYFDRDDIALEVEREAAKARIKDAIHRGDLPAEKNPQAGVGASLYGPGVWRINPAAAICWATARFQKFPDWLNVSYLAKKHVHAYADIPAGVIAEHLNTPSRELPTELADHLERRLKLIGWSLAQWDEWSHEHRRKAVAMADEKAAIARSDAERERQKRAEGSVQHPRGLGNFGGAGR